MIAHSFDEAFPLIRKLVQDFRQDEARFLSPAYNETAVREVFINRFWMALGWDVTHETQKNPHACEVSVEKNVNVEGRGKRADYSFAVAPNYRDVRFFVEAKKPSRRLDNAQDYFQTIRYGWHARTPVAVLMDFEQFRVLDCRYKPDIDAVLQYGALEKFHYTDYADEEKFRRLYHLFSREDVARGSLEEYAASLAKPGRRGAQGALFAKGAYQSIDESFLQDLDGYREQLARAFKQGNPQLDGAQLTEATQRTLDRLVFMRFLEDKLIETDELVERFAASRAPWAEFVAASRRLDRTYNGIIFKEHALVDAPAFRVDERAFAGICENLSHTRSPYDFNLIPIHILGSIYERFLGKTIVVDADGATVVEKPEVRKAGGVYYTPEYIVRYIVEQTVGKLIAGKTPEEIRPLRFADISCGSGSFLLGVFDLLLSYHAGYYNRNKRTRAEGLKAGCTETDEGTLRLSLLQKRTILLNNIYGVDVDAQAVEVAQLSLYLKLLEAETTLTTRTHQLAFREALLPSLGRNIVSGNSLVDFDILSGHLFEPEAERKLNPMNFAQEFPAVMRDGGFDAIVGNPPYVRQELLGNIKPYLQTHYKTYHGVADLFVYFFERGLSLLKEDGVFGIIVGNKWLRANYGEPLRRWLKGQHIDAIIDFGDLAVFQQATTYPCIIFLQNGKPNDVFSVAQIKTLNFETQSLAHYVQKHSYNVSQTGLDNAGWSLTDEFSQALLDKLRSASLTLNKHVNAQIYYGIKTGFNEAFVIDAAKREELIIEDPQSADLIKPFLVGRDIKRYLQPSSDKFVLFTRRGVNIEQYPAIKKHLLDFKEQLTPKPKGWKGQEWKGRKPGSYQWYEIQDTVDYYTEFENTKILWPGISAEVTAFALDEQGYYGNDNTQLIITQDRYLLGLLNSRLLRFVLTSICDKVQGGFYRLKISYIEQLPIRTINFSDAADRARHDRMVSLVEAMLGAKRQLAGAGTEAERNLYERKCAAIDAQIDALVYELYALTPQEIALVEASPDD
ncbi:MAG TPA: TaqI-like C-terminal specificity domain-containing protein [Pyrinomonadaceae bacterium]|nr:TaqI-like C-terminal specificity domain-containing protein [Pyrinomonadaceae bacterium]